MTPRILLERLIGAPFDDHPDWLNGAPFDNPMPTPEWTLWQVTRATLKAIRSGANPDDPTLPLPRWHALWDVEDCRIFFEARGDCFPVLGAIYRCIKHQLVVPEWAATAYETAYEQVADARVGSFDQAFGLPYGKGAHLAAIRKRQQLAPRIHEAVRSAVESGQKIDQGLFEEIGAQFHVGKTLANDYYYDVEQIARIYRRPCREVAKTRGNQSRQRS